MNNDVTKVEDDELNTACLSEINDFRKKKLIALCHEGGQPFLATPSPDYPQASSRDILRTMLRQRPFLQTSSSSQ
jgi:hypothetical protein